MIIGAVVMAAGLSRRMGAAKLAMPIDGRPMLAHVLAMLDEAFIPPLVVLGAHEAALRPMLDGRATVHAADHAAGLAHSLKAGLAAIPTDWSAFLIVLGDMPFIRPETIRTLAAQLAEGAPAVVPTFEGRRGNPVGFQRAALPDLLDLEGDRGARAILHTLATVDIAVSDPGILRDVDRPEDLPR